MSQDRPELSADPRDRPGSAAPRGAGGRIAAALVLAALVAGGWMLLRGTPTDATPAAPPPAAETPGEAPAPAPQVLLPEAAPLSAEEVPQALEAMLGRKAVATFLQPEDFARRFVATIDNLGRRHAPVMAWPVLPTPGRFEVEAAGQGGAQVPSTDNAARYAPFVLLVSTVDARAAVRFYARVEPLLQQAWQSQGMGPRDFNSRLLEVIDLLLATPEPATTPEVRRVEVRGPIASTTPWTRYEFADPALEALPAGQKMLLRMGPVNERRLKAKLQELRAELVRPAVAAAGAPTAETPAQPAAQPVR